MGIFVSLQRKLQPLALASVKAHSTMAYIMVDIVEADAEQVKRKVPEQTSSRGI